jgi:hypothetical protein
LLSGVFSGFIIFLRRGEETQKIKQSQENIKDKIKFESIPDPGVHSQITKWSQCLGSEIEMKIMLP